VLKIFDFEDVLSDPEIKALITEREQARKEKNWDLADKIREQLRSHGVLLKDSKI
jgi:cysteinyl-tRNA synthetase